MTTSRHPRFEDQAATLAARFLYAERVAHRVQHHPVVPPFVRTLLDHRAERFSDLCFCQCLIEGAAFDEAVKCRPGRIVTLRQKTRLLADSRQKN